jgi:hypothetical protein
MKFLNNYHPKFLLNDIVRTIEDLEFINNLSSISVINEFEEYFKMNIILKFIYESSDNKGNIDLNFNDRDLINRYFDVIEKFNSFFK